MPNTKRCSRCKDELALDLFASNASRPDGKNHRCKECDNEARRIGPEGRAVDEALLGAFTEGGEELIAFGHPLERASAEALLAKGSVIAAARELQLEPAQLRAHLSELQRRAAMRGYSPAHDMSHTTPEGFHVKGTSTYYGKDGLPRGQWVKTKRDEEHKLAAMLDAMSCVAERWKGKAEPSAPAPAFDADLLAVYPMGDPHLGMYAWAQETGQHFDLEHAERNLVAAVDHLVAGAPNAREALIINLGDFFHADNSSNQTARSHHALDVDTRWGKVLGVGIRTMRRCIDRALEKHESVRVINEIGNHDDHSSIMLGLCLAQYYEREPRVTIDTSPEKFHWYRFGRVLIGTAHGDAAKPVDLPLVMAHDRAEDWGQTEHRYWYSGHVHHDSLKEFPGVVVETFRTLAPRDNWHHSKGYRSGQDMKCDIIHREWGRINRHVVGIRQIWHNQRSA